MTDHKRPASGSPEEASLRKMPATSPERLAHASSSVLETAHQTSSPSKIEQQEETARRRLFNKTEYDRFTEESELRRKRASHLMSRNQIWDESIKQVQDQIEAAKARIAELAKSKEQMLRARRELNELLANDVQGAREDIATQRRWDDFFGLKSDEVPA